MDRRRGRAFAGLAQPGVPGSDDEINLTIFAVGCNIHEDDQLAAALADAEQLLPVLGDFDNLTDRFDARLLLESSLDLAPRRRPPASSAMQHDAGEPSEAELNAERFRDLDPSKEHLLQGPWQLLGQGGCMGRAPRQAGRCSAAGPGSFGGGHVMALAALQAATPAC